MPAAGRAPTAGKLLVVGPLKTPASQAVLSLPAFAVDALRDYRQLQGQRPSLRLLLVQPGQAPRPVELDLLLRTGRDTPVRPEHASRAFRAFAQDVGIAAHPHLLRHSPGFRTHVVGPCQGSGSCRLLAAGQVTPAAAGVKVERPTGRATLTPARTGAGSRDEKARDGQSTE